VRAAGEYGTAKTKTNTTGYTLRWFMESLH
jgi:hypothetical protein